MKITIFASTLGVGGTERVICNLANFLSERKHDVDILTMSDLEPAFLLNSQVTVIKLLENTERRGRVRGNLLRIKRLARYIRKNTYRCFLVMPHELTIMLLLLRPMVKGNIIASERANPENEKKLVQILLKILAGKTDGYVFQTAYARNWYKGYIKHHNYKIIPNAVNCEFIQNRYQGMRKKEVVSVGRLVKGKDFPLLLRAFKAVRKVFPDYLLRIYGDGELRGMLEEEAERLGIGSAVYFMGFVSNVPECIREAALFVSSSEYEGMSNTLAEAMALGLPCVSTDCHGGAGRFLIHNGTDGILVPVKDEKALAGAMIYVLEDSVRADTMGRHAAMISKRLSPDRIYGEWEMFLERIIAKTARYR